MKNLGNLLSFVAHLRCVADHFQFGSLCFCGNSFGKYGSIDSSDAEYVCDSPCTGNRSQMCGGTLRNFVYNVSGTCRVDR